MKDRWKILWICVAIAIVLGIIIGSLTSSFKKVQLRQYGIMFYTIFNRVETQTARTNGNYLIGFDYGFHKFPAGVISLQFNTMTLTKDMSMVQIQGLFTGRLIKSQVSAMYEGYGFEYMEFLKASVEEFTRQAIETYSLSQIINNRYGVQNNVKALVCLQIQTEYSWVQCDYVSLGRIGANIPQPQIIAVQQSYEQKKIQLLTKQIQNQKLHNFYKSGGFQILKQLQTLNSKLFKNVTQLIQNSVVNLNQAQIPSAARYYLLSSSFPALNNTIKLNL